MNIYGTPQAVKTGNHELAMPLEKARILPKWMVGAAKRVDLSPSTNKTNSAPVKRTIGMLCGGGGGGGLF